MMLWKRVANIPRDGSMIADSKYLEGMIHVIANVLAVSKVSVYIKESVIQERMEDDYRYCIATMVMNGIMTTF
jgi:hypothetical protein